MQRDRGQDYAHLGLGCIWIRAPVSQWRGNPYHNYGNLYASTAGTQNSAIAGYILPHAQDNCSSTGDHTHQFYESGPYDTFYSKNTAISSTCDECYTPYPIWSTHEYGFQFTS